MHLVTADYLYFQSCRRPMLHPFDNRSSFRMACSPVKLVMFCLPLVAGLLSSPLAHAQPLQVRFVTYNVDFNNTAAEVDADIQELKPEADIMMFQEAKSVSI